METWKLGKANVKGKDNKDTSEGTGKVIDMLARLKKRIEEMPQDEFNKSYEKALEKITPEIAAQYAPLERMLMGEEVHVCSDCRKTYTDMHSALTCCVKEEDDYRLSEIDLIV